MLERITALLREKAEANAAHDGVPVQPVHLHGAAHELSALLLQARDRLIGRHGKSEPEPAPVEEPPAPVAEEPAEPAPAPEPEAAEPAEEMTHDD